MGVRGAGAAAIRAVNSKPRFWSIYRPWNMKRFWLGLTCLRKAGGAAKLA